MSNFRFLVWSALAIILSALVWLLGGTPQTLASPESPAESQISPAAPEAPVLDHYWCYKTTGPVLNANISLHDQFTTGFVPFVVGAPTNYCNPVKKKHGDLTTTIIHPNAHLVLYEIGQPSFKLLKVRVKNQFGRQELKVFAPAMRLAVPTQRNGQPPPADLDHFKCYKVKGAARDVPVDLKDELTEATNLVVGKPVLLCNPTRKLHNNVITEIKHPKAHLVCYRVTQVQYTNVVFTLNQFGALQLPIQDPNLLCVPSNKRILE